MHERVLRRRQLLNAAVALKRMFRLASGVVDSINEQPQPYGCKRDECAVVGCELVVAGWHTPTVLSLIEEPLDQVASAARIAGALDHCGFMPANLITLVHLSTFSAMNLANSSGEFGGTATAPRSANRCLMFGSSTAALVCWLSVAMISGGVPLGTPKPIQPAPS